MPLTARYNVEDDLLHVVFEGDLPKGEMQTENLGDGVCIHRIGTDIVGVSIRSFINWFVANRLSDVIRSLGSEIVAHCERFLRSTPPN